MGKKGSWFSAIKRVFTHSSKEKVANGSEKRSSKEEKKKKKGKHGDGNSFLPIFRQPSSIEQILGDAEREHQAINYSPPTPPEKPKAAPPRVTTPPVRTTTPPRAPTPPRDASPPRDATPPTPPRRDATEPTPPRVPSPPPQREDSPPPATTPVNTVAPARDPSPRVVQHWRPEPTLKDQHNCATKIQAAYRGYMARRSYRALRGLVRLQGVVKGQSMKRQTANALKCMQLFVRVQTQIQSRRVQMLENQALRRQALYKNDKALENSFCKWLSENQEDWDDSTLTKEEMEARMKRKFDAVVKRERAMAYAYSHQLWKLTPRIAHGTLSDFQSGGYPYWWSWLEQRPVPPMTPTNPSQSPAIKNFHPTPTRPTMDFKASPLPHSSTLGQPNLGFNNTDTPTPRSTRSSIGPRTRQARTPPSRLQQKFSRGSAATSPFNGASFRDDASLTSCPPFSVPRYMVPTVSAKMKGVPDSPSNTTDESKRRASFPLSQGVGSFKWNKGKETGSPRVFGKNQSLQSVGNLSVDSTASMPVTVGRKPFNRFV